MADTKLADLTALTTPSGDDLLYVVDDPAGTPADRKLALDNLFTRGTVTTSSPVIDASQTWNDGGVTFTGLRFNAATGSSANSAAGSLLMDLQLEGSSQATVSKAGIVRAAGIGPITGTSMSIATNTVFTGASTLFFDFTVYGGASTLASSRSEMGSGFKVGSGYDYKFSSTTGANGTPDLFLTRRAAANLRLGAADAAAPVAQTLSVQSVVAGTTNTAGADLTITGSQGTGTGAGGSIIFQVAPAGSSGTAQNALVDSVAIQPGDIQLRFGGLVGSGGGLGGSYNSLTWFSNGIRKFSLSSNGALTITSDAAFQFRSATAINAGSVDLIILRDDANTLALRNGANAQAFRVYNTYTASDNFERANIFWDSNVLKIGTEKGSAGGTDRAVYLASSSNIYLENGGFLRWGMVGTDPNFIALRNTGGLKFSSSTSFPGTPDVGIARSGTNTLKITNGSTGTGALESASLKTDAPTGGTAATWKLGTVASVSPTLPNRTIEVEIGGTTYYISAKTTND